MNCDKSGQSVVIKADLYYGFTTSESVKKLIEKYFPGDWNKVLMSGFFVFENPKNEFYMKNRKKYF